MGQRERTNGVGQLRPPLVLLVTNSRVIHSIATFAHVEDSDAHRKCQGVYMSCIENAHVPHTSQIVTTIFEEGTGFEPANVQTLPRYKLGGISHSPTPPASNLQMITYRTGGEQVKLLDICPLFAKERMSG